MKRAFSFVAAALLTAGSALPALAQYRYVISGAGDSVAQAQPIAAALSADQTQALDRAIQDMQQSADPTTVISAYARGLAVDRNSPRLHDAYVHRMVQLGLPDQAAYAAQLALAQEPQNALARGVVAYNAAKHGDMTAALTDIAIAVKQQPDDPFLQRTCGQLLAWYDTVPKRPDLPASIVQTLAEARTRLTSRDGFVTAYQQAVAAYRQQVQELAAATQPAAGNPGAPGAPGVPGAPGTQPGTVYESPQQVAEQGVTASPDIYTPLPPPTGIYNPTVISPPYYDTTWDQYSYATPYYPPYGFGPPAYPYTGWNSWWWWSPGFVIIGNFGSHHDHFEHAFHNGSFHHDGSFHSGSFHNGSVQHFGTTGFTHGAFHSGFTGGAVVDPPGAAGHAAVTTPHFTSRQTVPVTPHWSGATPGAGVGAAGPRFAAPPRSFQGPTGFQGRTFSGAGGWHGGGAMPAAPPAMAMPPAGGAHGGGGGGHAGGGGGGHGGGGHGGGGHR